MKYLVRAALTALNAALCLSLVAVFWPQDTPAVQSPPRVAHTAPPAWSPPVWFPEANQEDLWVLQELDTTPPTPSKSPKVRAASAIIADLDQGEVLWAKNADSVRSVASLTKMVSALAMSSEPHDLSQELCVTPQQYTTRSGARSRFETGMCHEGWEFLGAALVASDNRGAMGLATLSGLDYEHFISRMDEVSNELGMERSSWADPSGLEDENLSTARDMLKAVIAVSEHPELSVAASAPSWQLDRRKGPHILGSTNRLVRTWDTLAAKTGYTDTARYCFATVIRTKDGRRLALAVLGAPTVSARFTDARAMVRWAESQDL